MITLGQMFRPTWPIAIGDLLVVLVIRSWESTVNASIRSTNRLNHEVGLLRKLPPVTMATPATSREHKTPGQLWTFNPSTCVRIIT